MLIMAAPLANAADEVVVIANRSIAVQSLSRTTAQSMFTMRLGAWSDQSPVRVFVLPDDHAQHVVFCREVLGIFPHQLRLAWDRLVFSGTGQAPIEVANMEEMIRRVATTPGAIGYATRSNANDRVRIVPLR